MDMRGGRMKGTCHVTRRVINMILDGRKKRERHKKRWTDCMNEDMRMKAISADMTADRKL